ncbi:DUF3231 family protein [Salinibacillus xinjiangensis]|uniref:DUF3231 family protein n=1 Tax=Salinibacillus xinjiangensis TaxID=1229268 RepID=A0A6G1X8J6_9BACI|nr:DUF3231 family protein [Salinibacillus xinjiangensis]MRG87128.1 DUF3231 family protein [Salinibacillus xinjiangensis]
MTKPNLTAAELSQLWGSYQNDTLVICVLHYFLQHVRDEEIRAVLSNTLEISEARIPQLKKFFQDESHPTPKGFNLKEDVNLSADQLFTDPYMLFYTQQIGVLGLNAFSMAIPLSARKDIYDFYSSCLTEANEIHRQSTELLLEKGLYIRPPTIPAQEKVDFVKSSNFLQGFFGERRPLLSLEITNLFANIQRNELGVMTLLGFRQAVESEDIREFMKEGKEIASKHAEVFGSILREEDLPVPVTSDIGVTKSTEAPFSDKLMMFHVTALIGLGIGYYGASMSTSPRRDLATHYTRFIGEIGKYSEKGAKIMIKHGWMEEPPRAVDRDELAKKK